MTVRGPQQISTRKQQTWLQTTRGNKPCVGILVHQPSGHWSLTWECVGPFPMVEDEKKKFRTSLRVELGLTDRTAIQRYVAANSNDGGPV